MRVQDFSPSQGFRASVVGRILSVNEVARRFRELSEVCWEANAPGSIPVLAGTLEMLDIPCVQPVVPFGWCAEGGAIPHNGNCTPVCCRFFSISDISQPKIN